MGTATDLIQPVRFEWLEQKVTEWGCMQALIDFEGWRKWRGFADSNTSSPTSEGYTSPLQMGNDAHKKPSSAAPATRQLDGLRSSSHPHLIRSETAQEDSSASGSMETPDSPASPMTTVPVEDPAHVDGL